ncbi:NADPH-dependent F420 reductase [Sphingobium sp.]|uniref:NADPH-dependent F420 reductase n=1 Tax=Sphingobium sp. TaxID=1912891 RepID=UPI002B7B693C|nr:NAD(P)-binding domain-containing protein [Sphingobium sp.]HUD91210.1 NAD(P)-binding domain-containing protein [Sphingobium sp.]
MMRPHTRDRQKNFSFYKEIDMKIGLLGTGSIGKTLARKLSEAGHDVKVANSRGPETIDADVLEFGARAVQATEAVVDVEVVILSIPLDKLPGTAGLISKLPPEVVVIDTSNYYPMRDGTIDAIEQGQVESLWVVEKVGRPIVKAWNAIFFNSFLKKGKSVGSPDRIALPVAADNARDKEVAMALVGDTGFDAVDAGPLADSWRQQPGSPAYCTDLTRDQLPGALAAAERPRLAKRRDLAVAVVSERLENVGDNFPDLDFAIAVNRAIYL